MEDICLDLRAMRDTGGNYRSAAYSDGKSFKTLVGISWACDTLYKHIQVALGDQSNPTVSDSQYAISSKET